MAVVNTEQYIREIKLRRERVSSFDQYPFSLPVVRNLHSLPLHPAVTFIIGENGSGKSTLLESIAVAWGFNAEGGTKNFNFQTRRSHFDRVDDKAFDQFERHKHRARIGEHARHFILRQPIQ